MEELLVEAKLENMDTVVDFINARLVDCNKKTQNQIGIAVDEVFSNIVHYAYTPEVGKAIVRIAVDSEVIAIEFEDNGIEYNPLFEKEPDITSSVEEREISGLGVFMLKNIMDSVEYKRKNSKNILTIKKNKI